MKSIIGICLLIVAIASCGAAPPTSTCECGLESIRTRIVNGKEAQAGRYPWMVLLSVMNPTTNGVTWARCGGSIISDRHVLTAAHCTLGRKPHEIKLYHGVHHFNETKNKQDIKLAKIYQNTKYEDMYGFYDISVLELETPLKNYMPICLPTEGITDDLLKETFTAGLGMNHDGKNLFESDYMQEVNITIGSQDQCQKDFKSLEEFGESTTIDYKKVICGRAKGQGGSCKGDSGGPLMARVNGQIYGVGITSFGDHNCGYFNNQHVVYERTFAHLKWINLLMDKVGAKRCI